MREAATEIERLEAELTESRKKLAQSMGYALKADEQCNEIKAELAAANAKINKAREICDLPELHYETLALVRRALADPAPQESHAGSLAGSPIQAKDDQC